MSLGSPPTFLKFTMESHNQFLREVEGDEAGALRHCRMKTQANLGGWICI